MQPPAPVGFWRTRPASSRSRPSMVVRGVPTGTTKKANEYQIEFSPKLRGARSRLYRRRFLQVNNRWKALDEINKIYILFHRSDL